MFFLILHIFKNIPSLVFNSPPPKDIMLIILPTSNSVAKCLNGFCLFLLLLLEEVYVRKVRAPFGKQEAEWVST